MASPAAEAAHSAINIVQRYMSQQQMSIDRQRELVAKLQRDRVPDMSVRKPGNFEAMQMKLLV
jgi:hypothetical protein